MSARLIPEALRCAGRTLIAAAALVLPVPGEAAQDDYAKRRNALVEQIQRDLRDNGLRIAERVADAMRAVPRHEFVPAVQRERAYLDQPLPIGAGQTISQPFIVALMTELAAVNARSRVLEVGTGSGYQAAVLARLADHVYTIEIVESLGRTAAATLNRLGYDNVSARIGDGYAGWPEAAPFDAIVVTAAPEQVPAPLLAQLAPGGRMVIPVGPVHAVQSLRVLEKDAAGKVTTRDVLRVRFVPFVRPQ